MVSQAKTERGQTRRPSKEQVRVWLDTVVGPLLQALRIEEVHADDSNWTFDSVTNELDEFWHASGMVDPRFRANLLQFFRYHPGIATLVARHDRARDLLLKRCAGAFRSVLASDDFQKLAGSLTDVREEDRRYLAENVVNGLHELGSQHIHRKIWAGQGAAFLRLAHTRALREAYGYLANAGDRMRNCVKELRRAMEQLQMSLSDDHQLPPIDPAGVAA